MEKPQIYKKLLKVIEKASKVEKSGYNSHQKYNYVMEADLLNSVRKEIITQGLLITTSVEELTKEANLTTVKTKHIIYDVDSGESITVHSFGQGSDNQDKGSGKAITAAVKYFYMKTFMVESNNDIEDDGGTKAVKKKTPYKAPVNTSAESPSTEFKPRTLSRGN